MAIKDQPTIISKPIAIIKVGEVVGDRILDNNGKVLVNAGVVLSESLLKSLEIRGIEKIPIGIDSGVLEETHQPEKETGLVFSKELKQSLFNNLKKLDVNNTVKDAEEVVDSILTAKTISREVYYLNRDEELFEHSLAVTEFAVALGRNLDYTRDKLEALAAAALLHDIGKIALDRKETDQYLIDDFAASKGIDLNELSQNHHTEIGTKILASSMNISAVIRSAVMFHHENVDGTGLYGKKGNEVIEFARIIRIADAYSRIITGMYSEAPIYTLNEAIEYMQAESGKKFDSNLVKIFTSKIPLYPEGLVVKLSNGLLGRVVENSETFPTRPTLEIVGTSKVIDLVERNYQNIVIVGVEGSHAPRLEMGRAL